ncbi:MAG: hypothetical protein ACSLEY_01190 [Candidatus Saccharimonadales bacterium]
MAEASDMTAAPVDTVRSKPRQGAKQRKTNVKADSKRFIRILKNHRFFIVSVGVLLLILVVLLRVTMLNSIPVDQSYIQSELSSLKKATFDEDVIKKMEALKESGVTAPGSQKNPDRTNPFGE